jgi:hypothetical protein
MGKKQKILAVVGWREYVNLPVLKIPRIKAKVDTGARTSSLHAINIRYKEIDGRRWVFFKVHPHQKDNKTTIRCKAEVIKMKRIKSSNGISELRPIIRTPAKLLGKSFDIDISLTSRAEMGFRMLLGREALRNRFFVDVSKSYVDKSYTAIPKPIPPQMIKENNNL